MTIYASRKQPNLTAPELPKQTPEVWRDLAEEHDTRGVVDQLAHDLRQPIAAIRALAAAASVDAKASEHLVQRLRQIVEQADWISRAIDDALAESGTPEPVDIGVLVADLVASERLTYRGRITLEHEGRQARYVVAPATRLRRALANVLANATRAAGPDGNVHLVERADGGTEIIEIADDGPGFGQVAQAHGIGLRITEQALSECGGRMDVERHHPPGLTVARLMLPIASGPTTAGR